MGERLGRKLPAPASGGATAFRREFFTPGRSLGAFASEGCVATLRSLDLEVTAPGGMPVPTEGITNVSVMPAHRRQGLLRRMMRTALDDAVTRGRCLAALVASEYRIYGRFGFGPATTNAGYDIDVRRAGSVRLPTPGRQRVQACPIDDILTHGPELHDRFRRLQPGAINRTSVMWRMRTGKLRNPYREPQPPWAVLCHDRHGTPTGMALFHVAEQWRDGDPDYTLTVDDLIAVDPAASASIWHHLLDIEWVNRVTVPRVAPDDPLPLLLDNPRACVTRPGAGADHLWLRILDVPGALQARCYNAPGSTVLEVTDQMQYAAGRYAIETRANGSAHVTQVDDPPDLTLDVAELARVYLGDQSFHRLAAAGLLTAHRADAVARADWQFRTPHRPWCPDGF